MVQAVLRHALAKSDAMRVLFSSGLSGLARVRASTAGASWVQRTTRGTVVFSVGGPRQSQGSSALCLRMDSSLCLAPRAPSPRASESEARMRSSPWTRLFQVAARRPSAGRLRWSLRFLVLRCRALQQARQRALLLNMATCSSKTTTWFPLFPGALLQDVASGLRILDR